MGRGIEPSRAREILDRMDGRKFLVVGDLMLDRYLFGDVERISPEAPVPVVKVVREEERLGGAANVARNILSLGGKVSLSGVIGADRDGEAVERAMASAGIDAGLLVRSSRRPTTRKVRIVAQEQQVARVDHEEDGPLGEEEVARIAEAIDRAIEEMDGVILSDYGKGVISAPTIRHLLDRAKGKIRISVDPKVRHFSLYRGVSLVTPNLAEASLAAGEKITDDESLHRAGGRLLEMLPGTTVLLTRGAKGMSLFEPCGRLTHIATAARRVYDVTGAGDTVISTFAMAVAAGAIGLEAAVVANHAAGAVIEEAGAAAVSRGTLERILVGK